ncbi:GntR family transcriptional regulator [Kitasatospora sp. NPDC052896]|uniref:GntR family transcriptional regulator n=1 Tax=Kitasatospora sp. NPDC052896 TaxID=3364061 RepID=UPI0037C91080
MAGDDVRRRPVVALYERVIEAIQRGTYPPGSQLPSEPRLAADLGVSRPALREALILLQEDGVIDVRRGVGRTVRAQPRRQGFERLCPMEELLAEGGPVEVLPVRRLREGPTEFSLARLLMPVDGRGWFWESLIEVDGLPACLAQEWSATDEVLDAAEPALAEAVGAARESAHTMLRTVLRHGRGARPRGASSIAASILGEQRGRQFGRAADTPALLITQTVRAGRTPLLAAKYLLPAGAPALGLRQSG